MRCRKAEKKKENGKWIDEHGKRGVSTWPFEFKHMSDVVKTCQRGGEKKTGTERNETLGDTGY